MTLQGLGNMGGFIGAIAVLATLERVDRFGFDPRFIDHMNERLK